MSSPVISIQHVTKRFPGVTALAEVTLDVLPGELHAICGENGA
jgi:ABC-type sugar transport system ATPase subunit